MMKSDSFIRLFAYDMWANEQVLLTLQEHHNFSQTEQAVIYFSHIAGAQELWYKRIQQEPVEDLKVWPDYGLPKALQKLKTYAEKWKALATSNRSELDRKIEYQNSKGKKFATPLSDILNHVIIHGQHHRAQIAQLLRNEKIDPPATDFIFFSRSN